MDTNKAGRKKKPFAITCRKCGCNHVIVMAFDRRDITIKCEGCGESHNCGFYDTGTHDTKE